MLACTEALLTAIAYLSTNWLRCMALDGTEMRWRRVCHAHSDEMVVAASGSSSVSCHWAQQPQRCVPCKFNDQFIHGRFSILGPKPSTPMSQGSEIEKACTSAHGMHGNIACVSFPRELPKLTMDSALLHIFYEFWAMLPLPQSGCTPAQS